MANRLSEDGGSGTVGGFDVLYRFGSIYNLEFQLLGSNTVEPDNPELTESLGDLTFDEGKYTATFDGENYFGHGMYASLERNGRLWSFDFDFRDYSPTFRAETSFITSNSYREASFWTNWDYRFDSKLIQRISPFIMVGSVYNYEGKRKELYLVPQISVHLAKQTSVNIGYTTNEQTYRGMKFDNTYSTDFSINSSFSEMLRMGTRVKFGRTIRRSSTPELGRFFEWDLWATLKPIQRLTISPEISFARLRKLDTEEEFYSGFILRTRANVQFTRRTFMRMVLQYDNFDGDISIEPLLSYKVNPFSVFYIGSNQRFQDFGRVDSYSGDSRFKETDRQYFIKLQYLFQS